MNTSEFTEKSQQALRQAQQQALRRGHGEVDGEHLLLALLQERGGILSRMVQRLNGGDRKAPFARTLVGTIFRPAPCPASLGAVFLVLVPWWVMFFRETGRPGVSYAIRPGRGRLV